MIIHNVKNLIRREYKYMERLEFGTNSHYSTLEASIHLNRYLSAREFVAGKSVLDIACGEGYGSALLARWGAKSVVGVDISEPAIAKAKNAFETDTIKFFQSSGEAVLDVLGEAKFDLIVSFETIEHVNEPRVFLENIKKLIAPNGIILISCPNDNWYYADGGSNPYHLHRWNAWEFRRLTEEILGTAFWAYGTFSIGFATYAERGGIQVLSQMDTQDAMLSCQPINHAMLTHMSVDSAPSPSSVAYFLGVWGSPAAIETFVGYPVSMDLTKYMKFKTAYVDDISNALDAKDVLLQAEANRVAVLERDLEESRVATEQLRHDLDAKDVLLQAEANRVAVLERDLEESRVATEQLRHDLDAKDVLLQAEAKRVTVLERDLEESRVATEQLRHDLEARTATNKRSLRNQILLNRILREELKLVSNQLGHFQWLVGERDKLIQERESALSQVPWRVVRVWRRVRPFVPSVVLTLMLSTGRRIRRRAQ